MKLDLNVHTKAYEKYGKKLGYVFKTIQTTQELQYTDLENKINKYLNTFITNLDAENGTTKELSDTAKFELCSMFNSLHIICYSEKNKELLNAKLEIIELWLEETPFYHTHYLLMADHGNNEPSFFD